ncbi:TrkH family potassium uptake protein [Brevibacillus laterosporus]|uniref:Trk family potassium uptake protein n=1 Tax=Brevibacillus laterosporus TaxID=1465 RepID=A0AAP8QHE1_BRELA|nr:TrkH family potassium uptake protein [Brevibacillus laterosporus]ATO50424.1 Trk family potassium uptake protein [Brevibacillus laterosporus DSM 25]AYB39386.1 Trk family potassium uptake protein [Brevibacillus laterosporus]MBG9796387.1 ATP synthase subunit J [Brevibacillus laterosporus]MBG9802859.1 ATP synthase subunit J [Brevibacillus laterosporus]MBM7108005.1 Ktr system potassium uptake protein B [Brevibacillus laterosporus]
MLEKLIKKFHLSPPKVLVLGFALIIAIGTILLTLPIATNDGQGLSWINAFFTSTSATCVTGLVVTDTGTTFTMFGQLVILALIQVGGLGFMTLATFFALLMGKKISLKQRLLLQESLNQISIEGVVRLAKMLLIFTGLIELTGGILLTLRFAFDMPFAKALYYGMFHSISNFNNAGFDLMGEFSSLTKYVSDPIVNLTVCALIILGGIGFIVMAEVYGYRETKRLSLHTKVVLTTTAILIVVGTLAILILEFTNAKTLQPLSPIGKFFGALYQSVTARTAGSNTISIGDMRQSSLFFIIVLMFIGASPGSTGGGIKTTTFATLLGAVWAQIKGREDVIFYRQRILPHMIYKSLTVTMIALFIVIVVSMILTITEPGKDFLMILFESVSAFATVGLSMGLTPDLSDIGKIVISLTMFAGRVGPLTIAFALAQRNRKEYFRYPKGKIMIG